MNRKIIISLGAIAVIAAIAIGATTAYFSNTETSSGNAFIAGAVDLKIDNTCHYNGRECKLDESSDKYFWTGTSEECFCTWKLMDLKGKAIFNFTDVKPGDGGESTISLHVDSNPAWICAEISRVAQNENGCNAPEAKTDQTCGNPGPNEGELWDVLKFNVWMDNGERDHKCNNRKDDDETYLVKNANAANLKWPIADSQIGGVPIKDTCIGVSWSVPSVIGNIIQGDSVTGDIVFNAYQGRHNDNFVCNPPTLACGDNIVTSPETCELPNTFNNSYCGQSTTNCMGAKLQTRDGFGDCSGICGCAYDNFSNPVCVKDSCGAKCAVDTDCVDTDPNTSDTCNADTCQCQHNYVPSCGNGVKDSNEECDDHNTASGDGCSATCQNEYAYLIVHKEVVNNGVGGKSAGDFQMKIDTANVPQDAAQSVSAGSHTVSEADSMGYTVSFDGDCDNTGKVTAEYNKTKTCTVTNTMPYGTITVAKVVTNDNGGLLTIGNFTLKIDGTVVTSGVAKNVAVGAHSVSEVGLFGYSAVFSDGCNSSGGVTVAAGESKNCTITNNDIAPSIELVKNVVNGSALPDDFDVSIDGNIVTSGSSNSVMANTAHAIDEEVMISGYVFTSITGTSFKGVPCPSVLNGTITLLPGDVVTCKITNTH